MSDDFTVKTVQRSVALFDSLSSAIRAEKLLKGEGIMVKPIPVPRHLSSDCGICLRFGRPDEERIKRILAEKQVEVAGIHPV